MSNGLDADQSKEEGKDRPDIQQMTKVTTTLAKSQPLNVLTTYQISEIKICLKIYAHLSSYYSSIQ